MLVKKVYFNDFLDEFKKYDREDQFSYEGKRALYDYLNELGEDLGKPIELDVIALSCEFTEYDNLKEFNNDYSYTISDDIDSIDDIDYYTVVIRIDEDRFIIQNF